MPTKREKDEVTGRETTGHEWDGIRELDTPLPRWWVWTFIACIIFAAVYVVLYPAIPTLSEASAGTLGWSQREAIAEELAARDESRSVFYDQIAEQDLGTIADDATLMTFALAGGKAAFADNCAPCHGQAGGGRPGYPVLADDDWLWGGTLDQIEQTIRVGVRSDHVKERFSEMPSFVDALSVEERSDIAHYVRGQAFPSEPAPDRATRGQLAFEENCAVCHGENAQGSEDLGAPALNDAIWLYGGTVEQITKQISQPIHGVMPAWVGRLDDATIKMLALYVHSLGGGIESSESTPNVE